MASIEIDHANLSFGNTSILSDFSLHINDTEFLVLVGPSGCGKSSLLRLIAGLNSVDSGTISIDGNFVENSEPKDRDIAMVFQSYALYPHMSVFQNIAFPLKLLKIDKVEIKTRVNQVAKILELDSLLERKPKDLSGGQRQRVAMGRAIIRNPKAFLFDEPLSNLDASLRDKMRTEIKKLHELFKTTTVYVTHDQTEAMTLADRIVVLNQGKIQQLGTPKEIYESPSNKFVAKFMGSPNMNFCNAREIGLLEDDIEVGFRPEDLKLNDSYYNNFIKISAIVKIIEPLGAEDLITLSWGSRLIQWKCYDKTSHALGENIELSLPVEKCHFFHKHDGTRIKKPDTLCITEYQLPNKTNSAS